jgi:hypothetical protein
MIKFPFPGILTEQERANLEVLAVSNPLHHQFFRFDFTLYKKAKQLVVLPVNSLIIGPISYRVEESFRSNIGGTFRLQLGHAGGQDTILNDLIGGASTVSTNSYPFSLGYFKIYTVQVPIVVSVMNANIGDTNPPIQGKGYGVFTWLDLNKVEGYR